MAKTEKFSIKATAPGMEDTVERAKESFINGTKIPKPFPMTPASDTIPESSLPIQQNGGLYSQYFQGAGIQPFSSAERWMHKLLEPDVIKQFQGFVQMHYLFLLQCFDIISQTMMTPFMPVMMTYSKLVKTSPDNDAHIPSMVQLLEILLDQVELDQLQTDESKKPIIDAGIQAFTDYRKYHKQK